MLFATPSARSFARRLVVTAAVALASTADARNATRAQPESIVEDIAPLTREGFAEIVAQLPPLVPVRPMAAPATQPAAEASKTQPAASAQAESQPVDAVAKTQNVPQAKAAPQEQARAKGQMGTKLDTAPVQAEAAPAPSLGLTEIQPQQDAPAVARLAPQAEGRAEAAPEPQAADPSAPTVEAPAAPPVSKESTEPLSATAAPETAPPEAAVVEPVQPSQPAPPLESAKPAPAAPEGQEREGEGGIGKILLAGLALLIVFGRRLLRKKAGDERQQNGAKAARKFVGWGQGLVASLRAQAARPGAAASAVVEDLVANTNEKGEPFSIPSGSELAASLRAKIGVGPKSDALGDAGADAVSKSAVSAYRTVATKDRWPSAGQEDPELLEPGASGTHAIVMNARRKFRQAQA